MLVAFGEFLRNNQFLLPSAWCEEWWVKTIENSEEYIKDENILDFESLKQLGAKEAFEISNKYNVPLHPDYTYFYHDVSIEDLNELRKWIHKYYDDVDGR